MNNFIVAGIGTDVGKTIVSAILTTCLNGDYWKPIQCGDEATSDSKIMEQLVDTGKHRIHPPAYSFKAPLSPHHAARLENISMDMNSIIPPLTLRPLIIESVGGVFVPLSTSVLTIDVFKSWNCRWLIVSKHYLGSINHTLLTIEGLKRHGVSIAGIIFNGIPNPDSEAAILTHAQIPLIGQLLPEPFLNEQTIQRYAKQWQQQLKNIIP